MIYIDDVQNDMGDWIMCPCGLDECLKARTLLVLQCAKRVFPKEYWEWTVELVKVVARSGPDTAFLRKVAQSDLLAEPQSA